MSLSSIQICRSDSLLHQPDLNPLLKVMATGAFSHSGATRRPEQLVILQQPSGNVACMEATLDRDRFVLIGPILSHHPLSTEERRELWQAAIGWALSQEAVAMQVACDRSAGDCEILAGLGYPSTTDVGSFVCESLPWMISNDPDITTTAGIPMTDELVSLVQRTLHGSLDIPEAIPLRGPQQMMQGWIDEGGTCTFVAHSPTGPVGLLVAERRGNEAEITYVGVAAEARRRGWGARLFGQFLKWAKESGVVQVSAIVDRRNAPANQLYRRFGFRDPEVWMPVVIHPM